MTDQFVIGNEFNGAGPQKGYIFKVLDRNGDVCLLEKHNPAHTSGQKFYEVAIVQHRPKTTWPDGRVTEAHEGMPSPEEWGVLGWSPWDLEAARKKFHQLTPA